MDCSEFKKIADFLCSQGKIEGVDEEVVFRACSGRYYYEIYHIVKNWFMADYNDELELVSGASHEKLRNCSIFISDKLNDPDFEKLGAKLKVIHSLRVKADYHLDKKFTKGDLITSQAECLKTASLIDSLIKKYNKSIKTA